MQLIRSCTECGAPISPEARQSLCPRCLLGLGLKAGTEDASGPESSGSDRAPPHGTKIRHIGDYELLEEIASGGMGVVWRARQLSLDRIVAVKLLLLGQYASEEFIHRFRIEASAAASLQHPNIVAIHEVGVHQGQHYFAMDFVDGPTLAEIVRDKPLTAKRAAGYVKTIAEAIHFAHTRRILHRDLKPSNVLIDSNDQPRVTDFGLAKNLVTDSDLTLTGQVMGSPGFMPPEQALGERGKMGPASDVYSLGAILYHALTGRAPFVGQSVADTLHQVETREPVAPRLLIPAVPADLETICLKSLEKEPGKRFSSAQDLAEELGRFLRDEPIQSRPVSAPEKVWRWCKRKPVIAVLALSLLLAVAAGFVGVLWQVRRVRVEELTARQNLYVADMNLAQQALKVSNLGRARQLLARHQPRPGEPDLRHWEWRYLWPQCQSDADYVLGRHPSSIGSLSFSPDGQWLAAGGIIGEVVLWDVAARREARTVQTTGQYACAAFSADGKRLAATAQNGIVKVYEVGSWREMMQLRHGGTIRSIAFSPSGEVLVLFGLDQQISLWSVERANQIGRLPTKPSIGGHHGVVVFSPDSHWLAVGETDGHIRVLEFETLTERFDFAGPAEGITTLAFSPDATLLASGSGYADASIRLWSLETGSAAGRLDGHTSWVKSLAFSRDGKQLASASADQTIRLWDTARREEVAILRGHEYEVWALAFAPASETIASGGKDGSICIWSAGPRQKASGLSTLPGITRDASFSADGHTFATQNGDGLITLWDIATLQETRRCTNLGSENLGVVFSPNGRLLAVGSRSGAIRLLDIKTPSEYRTLTGREVTPVFPVEFTQDSQLLVCELEHLEMHRAITPIRRCKLLALDSGREIASWSVPPNTYTVALAPDAKSAVTGESDGTVRFWNVANGSGEALPSAHKDWVSGITFSPDRKLLATVSSYGDVKLWDAVDRAVLTTFRGHLMGIHSVAFSSDGRRLITASGGADAVKLWDVRTRQEVATLEGHGTIFQRVQFSPDGNALLAISLEGSLHLWRAPSFAEIEAAEKGAANKCLPSSPKAP